MSCSPWQNGHAKSFDRYKRYEMLYDEVFADLNEARVFTDHCKHD